MDPQRLPTSDTALLRRPMYIGLKRSMNVVRKVIQHLNTGQTPVVTFDQPLYAIAKQIQWQWSEMYGEDKFIVVFGGLHIEIAALGNLPDWLQGSGRVEALVQAEITTTGTADSFLRAAHVARIRRAHQVTAAALYILQYRANNNCDTDTEDEPFMNGAQRGKRELPSILVLGNSHVIGAVFTGLCAVPAAIILQHVTRCSVRTCPLVLCSGPHQLCPLDPGSSP